MNQAVVVAYGRSACCRSKKGSFAGMHPLDFTAQTLNGVLAKIPELPPEEIDDVIVGCAEPTRQLDYNCGRTVVQRAGLPESIPGQTVNRFCASGLQCIAIGANAIMAGEADVIVAGGVESMTDCFIPYPQEFMDPWLTENNEGTYMPMGETAERVADLYNITRQEMEKMACDSHRKAAAAQKAGKLAPSIIPVTNDKGEVITEDEGIRPETTMESLSLLKPCFRENGRITAATSSQTTDAAAFVVLMSEEKANELNIRPIALYKGYAVKGCESKLMGLGPTFAVPAVLKKTGLTLDQMDIIELNEAFAAQAIACIRDLKLPEDKVNVYGSAMALGHPMGATGAVLTCKALDFLRDQNKQYGLVTMCIGGGMGAAGIFENLVFAD